MDTDSVGGFVLFLVQHAVTAFYVQFYFAFSTDTIDEAVMPARKEAWEASKHLWIADPKDEQSKRTPLLFKYEYLGKALVALAPKVRAFLLTDYRKPPNYTTCPYKPTP